MSAPPFNWPEFEAEFESPTTKHIQFTPVPRLRARRRSWLQGSGWQGRLECQRRCGRSEESRARHCPILPRKTLGSGRQIRFTTVNISNIRPRRRPPQRLTKKPKMASNSMTLVNLSSWNCTNLRRFHFHTGKSGHEGEFAVLAFFAALLAAAPSPTPATTAPATADPAATGSAASTAAILEAATPWWERITVTVDGKGTQQSCRYETNVLGAQACEPAVAASIKPGGGGAHGLFKKVTFERRFSPGAKPDAAPMAPGDTLLGRQVMYLTIDAAGAIESCKVVSVTGDSAPDYDCDALKKERFSTAEGSAEGSRQAFMTVMAYGHVEAIA
jgi:hypothetical protein